MSKVQRQDIHCPRNIDKTKYEFIGSWYEKGMEGQPQWLLFERARILKLIESGEWRWADHHRPGQCDICGSHLIYSFVFGCRETGELVRIGGDCTEKFELDGDWNAFNKFKKGIASWRELKAGRTKAAELLYASGIDGDFALRFTHEQPKAQYAWDEEYVDFYQEWLDNFVAGLGVDIKKRSSQAFKDCHTIRDIVGKLIKYGKLSPKQTSFLGTLLQRAKDFKEAERIQRRANEERNQSKKHLDAAIGERVRKLVGEVTVAKDIESHFGSSTFFSITTEGGEVVKGFYSGISELERGDKIQFDATVKDHEDDPKWGKSTTVNRIRFTKIDEPSNV